MTEKQWMECIDPQKMVEFLRCKVSERKLRLFAAACCRSIWGLLVDERGRQAVEILERFADGMCTNKEIATAAQVAHNAAEEGNKDNPYSDWSAANAIGAGQEDEDDVYLDRVNPPDPLKNAKDTAFSAAWAIGHHLHTDDCGDAWYAKTKAHEAVEAALLRDIIGNPFRPVSLNPSWIAWQGCTIPKLAQVIYDERAFDRLPILANALEEAGCTNDDILTHCRQPREHVRGCWVVDLFLDKA
jgi:hypothetical protein